jgi:hypothetical protein
MQGRRQWIKERIPAFICRESNWWVSRWIQANILLCPHCREEYKSMKEVWDKLDNWTIDDPSGTCEENFSHALHQQFPSAFNREEERTNRIPSEWFSRLAFAAAALTFGAALFMIQDPLTHGDPQQVAERPVEGPTEIAVAEKPAFESGGDSAVAKVDSQFVSGNPSNQLPWQVESANGNLARPTRPPSPSVVPYEVVPVHTGPAPQSPPHPRSLDRYRRTFEVNNVQLTGFGSLSFPVEQRSY